MRDPPPRFDLLSAGTESNRVLADPRRAASTAFLSNADYLPFHKKQDLNVMIKY
jgi:hypothetical protein